MKKSEIKVGGTYTARVSGVIVNLRVLGIDTRTINRLTTRPRTKTIYLCKNLKTGRTITVLSAQRFKRESISLKQFNSEMS
jgi:hypothetical protein